MSDPAASTRGEADDDIPVVSVSPGHGPVIAVALHAGDLVRPSLAPYLRASAADRRREEDPCTAQFAPDGVACVAAVRSRFEVDLNRPRSRAVYGGPEDAWGIRVWSAELPEDVKSASLAVHDRFYRAARAFIDAALVREERVVLLDLHSYNHRRAGADQPPADPSANPEVNLGTARIDRDAFAPVVESFLGHMRSKGFDARENVKFGGGHFVHWVAGSYGRRVCPLAIEFKKTYMDEWTGHVDHAEVTRIRGALAEAIEPLAGALEESVSDL